MLSRTGLKYPSKLHSEKVASFLSEKARHHAIILAKGAEVKDRDNTDTELEFRQESNFLYLTGVQEADFYYIYDLVHRQSFLIAPDLDPIKSIWKGPDLTDRELLKKYNVDRVVRYSGLLDLLKDELKPKQIHGWGQPEKGHPLVDKALEHELEHYISHRLVRPKTDNSFTSSWAQDCGMNHPRRPHDHGPYGDHHGHRCRHHRDHKYEPSEPKEVTLFEALILARVNKTPIEIALSRESTRITSDAHRLVMKSVRAGMFEYQLEALFRYECARQGAKSQAYLPIVGAGVNAAYLHYTRNDTQIKDGQLILVDAACEADCYGSDITRTFPVNGRFSREQADIYRLVLEMQNTVISSMSKGVKWSDMNMLAQKIGVRGLKRIGILKGEEEDLFQSSVIKVFFPHGLGHLLGLNVHDDGLGLVVQRPPTQVTEELLQMSKTLPIDLHSLLDHKDHGDLPPPSSRRSKAVGSSLFATPSTDLEPGMLLTVEPGIYFNPARVEYALQIPSIAQYLDKTVLARYMSVGGVRIEDVVLISKDGTVDNITTAPKSLHEIEQIVQEGQREFRQSQERGQGRAVSDKKPSKEKSGADKNTSEQPRGIRKRVGVFKKLLYAIRNMF
ncbi:hypothetical protein EDD11_001614 [Mortierella claussenii]|nr:hypothetical protein EDD11_001614 [Mortierella claussenii]